MSENAQEDHLKFKRLTAAYCERLNRDFPKTADSGEDWIFTCGGSFAAFVERFPAPADRDRVLEEIKKKREMVRAALQSLGPGASSLAVNSGVVLPPVPSR
jgi:hypothetical protein